MKKDEASVVVEQTFDRSFDAVWNAITDVDQMRQWYFNNIPSFKPEVGFETQFLIQNEGRDFLHQWKVTEVVPKKKIVYNWKYDGYAGDSFVVFELFRENDLTRLKLTHQVREDFSDDVPEFKRESCVAGWKYFIQKSLKEFFEKNK